MRVTLTLLLLLLPLHGQECGTIVTVRTVLTIGDAPAPGALTTEPCSGPGSLGIRRLPDTGVTLPDFTAEWADMSFGDGASHSTLTSQTLPGGTYGFGDYQVPAGVTLTYSGAVRIHASHVRINGTVRTDAPGASIQFSVTAGMLLEGSDTRPATIETRGTDSPIEIGARWGITGKYRSEIRAEHGDILLSSGVDDSMPDIDLTATDVRARDGALTISSVNHLNILEGRFEGNGGGIIFRSRDGSILITDLVMDAGNTGPGIDMAAHSIKVMGRADLYSGAGPIRMVSNQGACSLEGVYSIYTNSGDQVYRASAGVSVSGGSTLLSNTGDIRLEGTRETWVTGSSTVSSIEGDISLVCSSIATLREDALLHSDRGAIRIDSFRVRFSDNARLGRGLFSYGPIEVRCREFAAGDAGPSSHIHGSRIDLHFGDREAEFGHGLVRAESGNLVINAAGPIVCPGVLEASADIRLDSEDHLDLTGATIRTDDRAEGNSGSIRLRCWAGGGGLIDLTDAEVTTGDAAGGSGDIELLVGELEAATPATAFILPKRVTVKLNEKDPSRSRITVSGSCDLGLDDADLTAAATLEVGGLDVGVPGMIEKAGGKKFKHRDGGVKFSIKPSKAGSSRATFKLSLTADLTGLVDPEADLTLRFTGDGVDGTGTVRLSKGRYALGRVRGALVMPGLYLARAKASLTGAGRDKLSLRLGMATAGTTPDAASDLTIGFGEDVSVSIPAASFTRSGDRYKFHGDIDGITKVVLDYARGTISVKGKGLDLGAVPEGPVEMDISVRLGDETRAVRVRMVRSGSGLRY